MLIVLIFFGYYMVVMGGLMLAMPGKANRLMTRWYNVKDSKRWGVVALVIGGLLCWASRISSAGTLICVFAVLSVLKGIYLLVAPQPQLQRIVHWWQDAQPFVWRVWGLVALVVGFWVVRSI